MIEEIRISSLGVIESSTLTLGPGLTVLTGETGAGKTMVVTALGLLLGGRADSGAVRTGAKNARVEGLIDASGLAGFEEAVTDAGGEVEDSRVVLARNIASTGRSRAFVGGASVPVSVLTEVSGSLVAVHGQSDQHRLLQPRAQREALDRFAGEKVAELIADWRKAHDELQGAERELAELVASERERAREADLLRFGLGEIEAVAPEPGEDAALASEEGRLGHADTLRTAAAQARDALSSEAGHPDALTALSSARTHLDGVRDHDGSAGELADRLSEVTYLVSDLSADLSSYASGIETDPTRLAAVSERRAALVALTRKYGDTVGDVLAWAESSAARLLTLDNSDERIDELRARCAERRRDLATLGTRLTGLRNEAAERLAEEVTGELATLAMPHARLSISVEQREADESDPAALWVGDRWLRMGSAGLDVVDLLLAANVGADPRPLAKGASGGELSRVMLALEVSLAGTGSVPTLVFDEVDAGVGGKAAVEVGARLAQLARTAQVLVVTHLPQVAAYADQHVVVEKSDDGSITTSGLTVLDDASRVRELSRMLAGVEESESALAHAEELIATARRRGKRSGRNARVG